MKNVKAITWDYLWYALYAFAGLGIEMLLLSLVEPIFFGNVSEYTTTQSIIHWILTILCWSIMIIWLIKSAEKKLDFNVLNHNQVSVKGMMITFLFVIACILLNAYDWGTLKIIGELKQKEFITFIFQYLYYFFEIGLVFLIVAFGQKFGESWLKRNSNIPFGSILLCCTWGVIHIVSKGSIITGLGVMTFAILYGMMYLALNRNSKYSFLAMLFAFII